MKSSDLGNAASPGETLTHLEAPCGVSPRGYALIAGPCSAETEEMTEECASHLAETGVRYFRAGIWKPRTHPGQFEGMGAPALDWMTASCARHGLTPIVEVATPDHLLSCLVHGIRSFWIGARTTVNPFAVQALADTIASHPDAAELTVLVKNPVNPDLELWLGALQRFHRAGIRRLGAVHRGFTGYDPWPYRNSPLWRLPLELMRREPSLSVFCDPSHMTGKRAMVPSVAQNALDMGFRGLMVEVHPSPTKALSDSAQQLSPEEFRSMIESLVVRRGETVLTELEQMRHAIDDIDGELMALLGKRMKIAEDIARYKKIHDMPVVQPSRYDSLISSRTCQASALDLDPKFIRHILALIHEESVRRQISTINPDSPSSPSAK